jgi:RimJ/RimL family protein N-acetyltransferase
MSISVIPIAAEHVTGFWNVLDQVARERKYLAMFEAPPIEQTRVFVLGNIAKGHTQLVALDGDRVIGWCDVLPKALPVHAHCGIVGMGLVPEFRGKGIGGQLLFTALTHAFKEFTRIELTVHADNAPAIALYRSAGFEQEGEMQDAVLIDGQYKNAWLMAILRRSNR